MFFQWSNDSCSSTVLCRLRDDPFALLITLVMNTNGFRHLLLTTYPVKKSQTLGVRVQACLWIASTL